MPAPAWMEVKLQAWQAWKDLERPWNLSQTAVWHHCATFGPYLVFGVNAPLEGSRGSLPRCCRLIRASRIRSNCTQIYTNGAFQRNRNLYSGSAGGEGWPWWGMVKWCFTTKLYCKADWIFEQTIRVQFSVICFTSRKKRRQRICWRTTNYSKHVWNMTTH